MSCAISRYIKNNSIKQVVIATCHYDVLDWLEPDWVFDASKSEYLHGRYLRPKIIIELQRCDTRLWKYFSNHHYLSGDINKSSRCWVATWEGRPVGFASVLAQPSGSMKNAFRGHRTVVLPDFQGIGIGPRISDAIGDIMLSEGKRYFSKTANIRLGEYREKSNLWRPTSKNKKDRKDYCFHRKTKESKHKMKHVFRVCYSHEYIGHRK